MKNILLNKKIIILTILIIILLRIYSIYTNLYLLNLLMIIFLYLNVFYLNKKFLTILYLFLNIVIINLDLLKQYFIVLIALMVSYLITLEAINYFSKIINAHEQKIIYLKDQLKLDGLTKLYNHNHIFSTVEKITYKKKNTVLAMLDIDNFKRINDNYGHLNGDKVIKKISEILCEYQNNNIICARYGGEEFCILFIDYSLENSLIILNEIKEKFSHFHFSFCQEVVTLSCGVCKFNNSYTPQGWLCAVDEALYEAKKTGKNCIVCKR